jgi:hypothetical protein
MISDMGRCRRISAARGTRPGRTLNPCVNPTTGYASYSLSVKQVATRLYVHRLVLEACVGPCPPGMEGTHINGDRRDNRLDNLRWATHAENIQDKDRHGTTVRGSGMPNAKLTESDVVTIRASSETHQVLADRYGVSRPGISRIRSRAIWKHVQ